MADEEHILRQGCAEARWTGRGPHEAVPMSAPFSRGPQQVLKPRDIPGGGELGKRALPTWFVLGGKGGDSPSTS